jgi:hypothetical protein
LVPIRTCNADFAGVLGLYVALIMNSAGNYNDTVQFCSWPSMSLTEPTSFIVGTFDFVAFVTG